MDGWVGVAQVVSGFAALAAVWVAVATARAARRSPLTEAYLGAWREILDVLAVATDGRDEPLPEDESDALMRRYRVADHQLSAIEATLRVRVYGRAIRFDLNCLLADTLYDNPDIRDLGESGAWLTAADVPRPGWAGCTDETWERVINSVPFASMWISQVWDLPGQHWSSGNDLMRWYYPVVLQGLDASGEHTVTAPGSPPQRQLAFMLSAYVDSFVLPWIRDGAGEALLGRLGWRGRCMLLQERRHRWRYSPPWRRPPVPTSPMLFDPARPGRAIGRTYRSARQVHEPPLQRGARVRSGSAAFWAKWATRSRRPVGPEKGPQNLP